MQSVLSQNDMTSGSRLLPAVIKTLDIASLCRGYVTISYCVVYHLAFIAFRVDSAWTHTHTHTSLR